MKRLLLVGWDAADWKVIDPLLRAGEMPNLARLIAGGVRGNLATIYPALSPMLWTSIATGKRAHKHGIYGFSEASEDGMSVRPISILGRKTKAFWNILNQHGKRSVVAGWWPSHPAEPIRGAMVSNHFPFERGDNPAKSMPNGAICPTERAATMGDLRVHPSEITGDILRMFVPDGAKVDQTKDRSLSDLATTIAETMSIHNAATDLMETEDWDLAAVYYCGIDHFSHRFMRNHAGKVRGKQETDPAIFTGIVANAYRYHDAMLGRLLALAGPECAVLVLSDHGFHSDRLLPDYIPAEAAGPAVEHRHFGIFCLHAPGVAAGGQVYGASVLDIAPTVLHLFGLPAGQDMDGKVLLNAFRNARERPRIPSWDEVPGEDGRHSDSLQYDSVSAAASLQQLVDLGYIAPLGEDARANVTRTTRENRYNLARACIDARRLDLALEILRELVAEDPEDGRFHSHLIHCRLLQGEFAETRKLLDAFDTACADFAPRAAEELRRKRELRPDRDLEANTVAADRTESQTRRSLVERADGHRMDRLVLKARLLLAQAKSPAKKQAAHEVLEQLAAGTGRRLPLALFLAESFAALGELESALTYTRRLRRADPQDWRAMGLDARIHHSAKRYDLAVECAVDSLALVYFQPPLHCLLGVALDRLGECERAEQTLRVAIDQMPGMVQAHLHLARILRRDRARLGEASLVMARANLLRETARNPQRPEPSRHSEPAPRSTGFLAPGQWHGRPPMDRTKVVTIVAGLPRSGTSMMMQMLAAGGIEPYTDGIRTPDEDNPRGYFEHQQATRLHRDHQWLPAARGKAVKIVAHLLPHLPLTEEYRIVFMHRNLHEVVASQSAMLARLGRAGGGIENNDLARTYGGQLVRVEEWLRRAPGVDVLAVNYSQALTEPAATARLLGDFLGEPFNPIQAALPVEPCLRRQSGE